MDTKTGHACDLASDGVENGSLLRCGCGRAWRYDGGWKRLGMFNGRLMRRLYPRGWRTSTSPIG